MSAPMQVREVDLAFKPRAWQARAHEERARFQVLVWHRRAGKTVFAILELLLAAIACALPEGRFAYVAPFYRQGKEAAWGYLKRYAQLIPGTKVLEGELTVVLVNGARIRLFGADNPDALRGTYFDGVVLDEVADMRPHVWGEIIRPALTDRRGWALFIGTPKGVNLFSQLYYDALRQPRGWGAQLLTVDDTQVIPADELELAQRTMTEAQYRQEFYCDFTAGVANTLIPYSLAIEAAARKYAPVSYMAAPRIIGVDVARFGDNATVAIARRGVQAGTPRSVLGADTVAAATMVMELVRQAEQETAAIAIDVGGNPGVYDYLKSLNPHWPLFPIEFGGKARNPLFLNKRVEMWSAMRDWLREDLGAIPNHQRLLGDISAPTYEYNNAGKFKLESKDDMLERGLPSPDYGDALALTFAVQPSPRQLFEAPEMTRVSAVERMEKRRAARRDHRSRALAA